MDERQVCAGWINSAEETISPTAFEVADAFAAQKNWSRLRRWTKSTNWGDSEYLGLAYQAYARQQSRQEGADAESVSLWHDAERACEENPEHEIRLARLASKWNLPSQAEQLWLRVAHNPLSRREALDALFEIYRASNDLPNLYLTAMRLHETSPEEPLIASEYARSPVLDRTQRRLSRGQRGPSINATEPPCALPSRFAKFTRSNSPGIAVLQKTTAGKLHDPASLFTRRALLDTAKPSNPDF